MTFRTRLFLAITMLLLVTLGTAFASVFVVVHRSELRDLDEALFEAAQEEALEIVVAGNETQIGGDPVSTGDDGSRLVKYAALYASDGHVLAQTPSFTCGAPPLDAVLHRRGVPFDLTCGTVNLRAVFARLPKHEEDRLLLAVPRTQLDDDARFLIQTMLVALISSIAVGAVVARLLVRGLTRDHEAIAMVARRVANGDLKARISTKSKNPEMVQLTRDVDEMIIRLEQLVHSQERFVAHAAHELRSPVTAIYGELSLALRKTRDAPGYREAIEHALESTKQLKSLAEELLVFARIGANEAKLAPVRLSEVVASAVAAVKDAMAPRVVVIDTSCDASFIEGHARDLERLVRNLVENAVRHSPDGSHVTVTASTVDDEVRLSVADEGSGIPEADRARIFEPFFRGAADRASEEGAGLGLAIVSEIARAHRGQVHLESEREKGACFVVRFPVPPALVESA
jgi:two-component system, OmpR family, sensor kinase